MNIMSSLTSTEDEVPGKPTNLRTQVLVGVMVRVSWDPPEKSHVIVRQYVVSYGKMKPDGTVHYVPNNTFSYLLKNLREYFVLCKLSLACARLCRIIAVSFIEITLGVT